MKNWYNSLTNRERDLVTYGSIIALLLLFWLFLINPIVKKHTALTKEIQDKKNTLELMQTQSQKILQIQRQNRNPSTNANIGNPQQVVEKSLQTWRLKPSLERMQSQGQNAVRLSLKDANVDFFMRFLEELETRYGLSVENLSITGDKEPGLADIRLTMKK